MPDRYDSVATASRTPRETLPRLAARSCPMSSGISIVTFHCRLPCENCSAWSRWLVPVSQVARRFLSNELQRTFDCIV